MQAVYFSAIETKCIIFFKLKFGLKLAQHCVYVLLCICISLHRLLCDAFTQSLKFIFLPHIFRVSNIFSKVSRAGLTSPVMLLVHVLYACLCVAASI